MKHGYALQKQLNSEKRDYPGGEFTTELVVLPSLLLKLGKLDFSSRE